MDYEDDDYESVPLLTDSEAKAMIKQQIENFVNDELPGSGWWDGFDETIREENMELIQDWVRRANVKVTFS